MRKRELLCALLFCNALISQNLLDTSTWTIGSGSVTGFSQHGRTAENSRAYGKDRLGNNVILWKATPDATSGADGGWNSAYYSVDSNKPYRFSVWIKKTTSTSGTTYFGFDESSDKIRGLNGTSHDNPYFWSGDLPRLGRWYLLVGFVHESSYTSRASQGAIYDGVTGKIVKSIMDYKMESSAVSLRHRSHLSYDTNASNQQYFYAPRMELLSGSEPTIQDLLGVSSRFQSYIYIRCGRKPNSCTVLFRSIVYHFFQICRKTKGGAQGSASRNDRECGNLPKPNQRSVCATMGKRSRRFCKQGYPDSYSEWETKSICLLRRI